jgi:deoxyribodipyrimidine photo-lyase
MSRSEQESLGVVIGRDYPAPIVDHASAREETLARYGILKLGKKTG